MKTIGLLGGMSWESTLPYYRIINQYVADRLGGLHSAKILLYSVDFQDIETLQSDNRWEEAGDLLADCAVTLVTAGAGVLVVCTNTMHKVADHIEARAGVPLLHIADPTAAALASLGARRVGLLGTRFTMEEDFYTGRLEGRFGLDVLIPAPEARRMVHGVIYDELCRGVVSQASRSRFAGVVDSLVKAGAEAVILGCTEISLLLGAEDADVPLLDTARLHAEAAAEFALS